MGTYHGLKKNSQSKSLYQMIFWNPKIPDIIILLDFFAPQRFSWLLLISSTRRWHQHLVNDMDNAVRIHQISFKNLGIFHLWVKTHVNIILKPCKGEGFKEGSNHDGVLFRPVNDQSAKEWRELVGQVWFEWLGIEKTGNYVAGDRLFNTIYNNSINFR